MKYVFLILLIMSVYSLFPQKTYEKEWKEIDSISSLMQPKTALSMVEKIYQESRLEKNDAQFLKASVYKMMLLSRYEVEVLEEIITSLITEIEITEAPVKNVLHSILAELYWRYYQNNRYFFLERTQVLSDPSDDIRTWDLRTLVQHCIASYKASLENPDLLKKIPVGQFDPILIPNTESRFLRPSLYDLLAHRVADFFMNSEAGITQPAARFIIDQPLYFAPPGDFSRANISTTDTFSFQFHAIRILQDLIQFHLNDTDPSALIDAELKRLNFVRTHCVLPEKDSLYMEALQKLEKLYIKSPASTEISYQIANHLIQSGSSFQPLVSDAHKWDIKDALITAEQAINRFPESFGAANCKALTEQIRKTELEITTEYAATPDKPALALVTYRNTQVLYLRIIQSDFNDEKNYPERDSKAQIRYYSGLNALQSWSLELPDDGDYQQHKVEIKVPELKAGYYILLASAKQDFNDESIITLNRFWRTGISYMSRRNDEGSYELYVAGREEGQPLVSVKVESFFREYDYQSRSYIDKPGPVQYTDKTGYLLIPSQKGDRGGQYYLVFTQGKDKFVTESYFSNYRYNKHPPRKITNTYFFTDRAIYRPGQTIYFKGIVIERLDKTVSIRPGYQAKVTLFDANGQKVSSLDLVSNQFGSFQGTFTAPVNVLTGTMALQTETGSCSFEVEEYKRPKFEVTFPPITGSYRLNSVLEITGKAQAYAGNNISDAEVSYRVIRTARFPYMWWGWREWLPDSPEMEITNGITTTDAMGEFTIRFTAIPDQSLIRKFNPVFQYRVEATVTDLNGETHDGESMVSVGYHSLLADLDIPEMVNLDSPLAFNMSITNLNGQKESSLGKITIWKLKEPGRLMRTREWSRPDKFLMSRSQFERDFPYDIYDNEGDLSTREKQQIVWTANFNSESDSIFIITSHSQWLPGRYLYSLETTDSFGEKVEKTGNFLAYSPTSKAMPVNEPGWLTLLNDKLEPGTNATLLIGSAARNVNAVYEVLQNDKVLKREILALNNGQLKLTIPVLEEYRGNFSVNVAFIKMNRGYQFAKTITVPWTNRKLDIQIASFRSKLLPGQEEEWQVTISGAKGEKVVAEMLAGMYDASLDAFVPHSWNLDLLNYFNGTHPWNVTGAFGSRGSQVNRVVYPQINARSRQYDRLNWFGFEQRGFYGVRDGVMFSKSSIINESRLEMTDTPTMAREENFEADDEASAKGIPPPAADSEKTSVSQPVKTRTDLNETAFFYPQLVTDENGKVIIRFRIPESLTRWKMMGLAFTKDLKVGEIEKTLITQKDLMVFPNAPRFFREGDVQQFSVKISNLSNTSLQGTAELHFFDALTMRPLDDKVLKDPSSVLFTVDAGSNTVANWNIAIPEGLQAVVYKVTASSGAFSDGEESALPVLTNRMLVTESLPLPVNGMETKEFRFKKLLNSAKFPSTLRNHKLTLEYSSNPAWYAVQALPYLMEYPYECAEQIFSRYYANSMASFIANSNPRIKAVFESWKTISPDALKSNLEKNQELKNVLLEESPWVRDAANETERKQRIAVLFDLNRMSNELNGALRKLIQMQVSNGGWPWFEGMPDSRYITQHIVTGLGHLDHLGVASIRNSSETYQMLQSALRYLDDRLAEDFERVKKNDKDYLSNDHLTYEDIQYLYARSYFQKDLPVSKNAHEAFDYYRNQAEKYWPTRNNYLKGMIALALHRYSNSKVPALILRSLSETALHNEEMGMYWRNDDRGWFWYQAPVETQALLIEAYDEILNDMKTVDELKVWLLKQKQTQDWKTTKATTEAIYALLLRGTDLLASDKLVTLKVGNQVVDPQKFEGAAKPEAGTGYFKTSWSSNEIEPGMGKITISNPNPTVAWGAMYWQYFEQLDKITPAETPLKLSKQLFREVNTPTGPILEPLGENTELSVGDKVVVRVELRSDRDMEYVHLKDMRASSFEPLNVLSGYRWQDGLGYYESTRDASSNFFISYLPKGTYVFEYRLYATQKGEFSNGITSVQCMYAPEFAAHSEGIRVRVH